MNRQEGQARQERRGGAEDVAAPSRACGAAGGPGTSVLAKGSPRSPRNPPVRVGTPLGALWTRTSRSGGYAAALLAGTSVQNPPAYGDDVALFVLALGWDLVFGELPVPLHPVVQMGRVARWLEHRAPAGGRGAELAYGVLLALGPTLLYAGVAAWLLRRLRRQGAVHLLVAAPLLKSCFAVRELRRAGERVRRPLAGGDLDSARTALRSLVSRDTATLDAALVAAAATESLAENLGDSIVAPFLAYAIAGVPGALAYRAVNTLDAMIGYRGRYEWLGKGAARLDDLLNLVPARLAAALLVFAAAMGGEDARGAWAAMRCDARRTASPNAGWPMAAMAGALGVELEKPGHYRLGTGTARPDAVTIARADRLVVLATAGVALLTPVLRALVVAMARRARVGGRRGVRR